MLILTRRPLEAVMIGHDVTVSVGGRLDSRWSRPVTLAGRVRLLSDGRFTYSDEKSRGTEGRMGRAAVIEVSFCPFGVGSPNKRLRFEALCPGKTYPLGGGFTTTPGIAPDGVIWSTTCGRRAST